ncbi:MAG: tetratricopeptide repeat protein [Candidatus Paracaedimonas acanthamoebae]|uniref:Tetratricopeptide repeat protein n=1 Tax=Candidatus Paracaedimonas acanthamoebae TaxID=244581 RepID=A0A8J7TTQ9_9PROT|nr:tetratricopeptide repeat protein [Candidatus Paracaedimonas acanthamoebae]
MQNISEPLPLELYNLYLSKIGKIYFTQREIDVISCLLHARGTSKIASLLSSGDKAVTTRTIERHIQNIMQKVECNTRDGIIDFIEKSDKVSYLRKYYSLLHINLLFEKTLKDLSKLKLKALSCNIIGQDKSLLSFNSSLKMHLILFGIKVVENSCKNREDVTLLINPENVNELPKIATRLIVLTSNDKNLFGNRAEKFDFIDLNKQENYYTCVLTILKKIDPNLNFEDTIKDFQSKIKNIYIETTKPRPLNKKPSTFLLFYQKNALPFRVICVAALLIISGFSFVHFKNKSFQNYAFRSDLILPKESAFLDRPKLIDEIENKLNQTKGIQVIALIGPGGSGKTTLARQYSRKHQGSIWEINAESKEALNVSFEKLAVILAKTEKSQQILNKIFEISNPLEKDQKVLQFVKEQLKNIPQWLLIYDNIENLKNIKNHIPHDAASWGNGKVILTTQNTNIENNNQINEILHVGELDQTEKLSLFTKILNDTNQSFDISSQLKEIKFLLENIPSFPLDISLAAYYIKATRISYKSYLHHIQKYNKEFSNAQEHLLNDISNYNKTRYNIIILSLKNIIDAHKDFKDLLLMLGLLNSQNIPLDLLKNFKNEVVVNNFIHHLKKYSFIINYASDTNSNVSISVHRSMQHLIVPYFTDVFCLQNNIEPLKFIAENIEAYLDIVIRDEDLHKMQPLINHCEMFLKHAYLLTPQIESIIKGRLGIIHYFYGNNIKAKSLFTDSISKLTDLNEETHLHVALFKGFLGNVFRDLGDYKKAKLLLNESIESYKKYSPKDALQHAYFLVYLGIIERYLGNYEAAKKLFENGTTIYKKHFPDNKKYKAWVYGQLGVVDRELGYYEEAEKKLHKSLEILRKERIPEHFEIAWCLEHLSAVYIKNENYKKAQLILEECLKIYATLLPDKVGTSWITSIINNESAPKTKNLFSLVSANYKEHFHDNYMYVAWPLRQLAILHMKLENYEKARIILEQTYCIYSKNYGEEDIQTAANLKELGQVYSSMKKYDLASQYLLKALKIFEKNTHPESYSCLEILGQLFEEKALSEVKKENQQSQLKKSINYFKEALKTAETHFGATSPHTNRIQQKLESLNTGSM